MLGGLRLGPRPPGLMSGGRRWWLAELADEQQLRAGKPPIAAIAALAQRSQTLGLCLFARSHDADFDLVVRAFPAGAGIVEDPASGAAKPLIAAYIAARSEERRVGKACVSPCRSRWCPLPFKQKTLNITTAVTHT